MVAQDTGLEKNNPGIAALAAFSIAALPLYLIVPRVIGSALGAKAPSGDLDAEIADIVAHPNVYGSLGLPSLGITKTKSERRKTMKQIVGTLAFLTIMAFAALPAERAFAQPAQQGAQSPADVVVAFINAAKARDVDAAMALVADGATITMKGNEAFGGPPFTFTGKDEIRTKFVSSAPTNLMVIDTKSSGDRGIVTARAEDQQMKARGVPYLDYVFTARVQIGLIHEATLDYTPETRQAIQAAMSQQTGKDPESVVRAFIDALNKSDAATAHSLVDPNGLFIENPGTPLSAEVPLGIFVDNNMGKVQAQILSISRKDGNTVEADYTLSGPTLPRLPSPITVHGTITVENGRITRAVQTFSEQTMRELQQYAQAQAQGGQGQPQGQPQSQPVGMPRTGEADWSPLMAALLVIAVYFVTTGLAVVHRGA